MSDVQMAGHYGNMVYVPRPVVGYSRGNPPKQQILPPTSGASFRSTVFRPRYLVRARGNPVNPPIPTAPLVFSHLQPLEELELELTVQPPEYPNIPTAPVMATWVYSHLERVAYPLLDLTVQPPEYPNLPVVPTMATWVYGRLQRVKVTPMDLTVQPPPFEIIPPPPTPPFIAAFYTMHPALLARLLIRGFITPFVLIPNVQLYPIFGLELDDQEITSNAPNRQIVFG
jgi:hypothetical protein